MQQMCAPPSDHRDALADVRCYGRHGVCPFRRTGVCSSIVYFTSISWRYHGSGERFVLASGRDPALVNKASDFLKDHHCVPPYWRQDENKGMVRAPDGRWIQPDRRGHLDDNHHHDGHHVVDGDHHGHFRLFRQP
ncbi:hypothetical protein TRIUR3_25097 [Triticum urartu]|uniref:Phospholipase A1 n=1 Tax=Triticum urartu TaxID=4572 RepID=M7ZCB0_TRIUA|nr:hypothetical protein TRIUR3_25097 [Triticum urartu]